MTDTAPLSQNEIDLVDKAIDEYVASAPNEYIFKQRKHLANMLTIIKNGGKRLTEVARIKFNEVEPNFSDGFVTFKMRAEKSNREILCGVEQNMFNELKESGFIYKNDVSASRCIYTFVRKLNKFIIEKYNVDLHLHPHKFRHNFVAVLLRTINPNTGNFHTTQDISECTGNLPSTLEKHYKHLVPERCVEVLKSISPNIVRNNGV
ncbi:MAG: site-specific integrase [Elusimicrobiota bacterium]|nr:site-specific integrase [Elusimicrobiota bacterium]